MAFKRPSKTGLPLELKVLKRHVKSLLDFLQRAFQLPFKSFQRPVAQRFSSPLAIQVPVFGPASVLVRQLFP